MLVIRLSRTGKSAQPSYRVIVSEKSKDPWGKYLEILGHYYPKKEAKLVDLKEERLKYWISKGAKLSETVNNILINQGVVNTQKVRMVKISKRRAAKMAEKNKKEEVASPAEAPKTEAVAKEKVEEKKEEPKIETPAEEAKAEAPAEETKIEEVAKVEEKTEAPVEETKPEEPKVEIPAEEPKTVSPTAEAKAEEPKS